MRDLVGTGLGRDAVMRNELVEAEAARAAGIADIGAAERVASREGERVILRAIGRVVIVGAANDAVGVERPIALRKSSTAPPRRSMLLLEIPPMPRTSFPSAEIDGNPVVDGVDDAADRLAAIAKRGRARAALPLRVAANGSRGTRVIVADVGDIVTAKAVLGHAHARRTQAADHGTRRARREARRGDARYVLQRIAETDAAGGEQFLVRDLRDARGQIDQVLGERRGGDDDRFGDVRCRQCAGRLSGMSR